MLESNKEEEEKTPLLPPPEQGTHNGQGFSEALGQLGQDDPASG